MFSLTTLMFANFVALKTQFTSKWTGSDIVKKNFPITQLLCVMGDNILLSNLSDTLCLCDWENLSIVI